MALTGFWLPVYTDATQTAIKSIMYHCLACTTTYKYVQQLDRCVSCGAPIDFEGLRELGRKFGF